MADQVIQSSQKQDSTVIFVHGFEDTTEGIAIICRRMAHFLPTTKFIIPQAPTIFSGQTAWYRPESLTPDQKIDRRGIMISLKRLQNLIDSEIAINITPNRVVVGGFSQGGSIAAIHALLGHQADDNGKAERRLRPSKYFLLASFIPEYLKDKWSSVEGGMLMIGHSFGDPLLPISGAEKMEKLLSEHGFEVEFFRYPGMQHAIIEPMQVHLIMFLLKCFGI